MRKSIKKIAASLLAATMVLGTLTTASAAQFTPEDVADGAVHYTVAGGINDWDPLGTGNEMQETIWDGVYSYTTNLPAFDKNAEWNSRFKICKIDEMTQATGGWTGSLCLGTDVYDDNQTMFRMENTEAIENAIVYFDSNTGAVVVMKDGAPVEYNFSWVGFDNEVQYTTVEGFADCGYTWPEDKIKVEATPDIKSSYDALVAKLTGQDLNDASLYANGEVYYTVAGGSTPYNWEPLSSANLMTETNIPGVYEFIMDVPAYSIDTEWLNRFKICKIDEITSAAGGWVGSICLGTTVADDNQTTFRVENETDTTLTIMFNSKTGAVAMATTEGIIDYTFSWVGYDNEVQYTTVEEFATCGYTWPADKVKVEETPDIKAGYDKFNALLSGEDLKDASLYANGEVYYTVAGGSTPFNWAPLSSANMMTETDIKGVYEFKMTVPAYAEATEYLNRFKICKIDEITSAAGGWVGSICLGTTIADDNQTTFRAEVAEETELTIKFDSTTGAVLIYDANGKEVDYKFSWVGYDNEVQYTTVSGFADCGYTWPADKLKVTETPDIAAVNAAFAEKLAGKGGEEPTTTTAAATTAATTAAATTAANQSTTTGDAAPVALLLVLMLSVAVVTVVAKKKEA